MKEILLPELGEDVKEATVSFWRKKEGDEVVEGDEIVEFYTDKANFTVKSPASGILRDVSVKEGEKASVGQAIAKIEEK